MNGTATPGATYALLGWPLVHSLSPAMHDAAFAEVGIDARYVLAPTPPDDLAVAVIALRDGETAGANVTTPHKQTVRPLLDTESRLVADLDALNTVVRTEDGLRGENTDVAGFEHALREVELTDATGRRALVLGAGGAARAVSYALLSAGFAVKVLARSTSQSGVLVGRLYRAIPGAVIGSGRLTDDAIVEGAREADLVVNATPVGAAPDTGASPWPEGTHVPSGLTVIDIVAWPLETRFVSQARAGGARAAGGLAMLVGQAAASFELWTGSRAPVATMRAAAVAEAASNAHVRGRADPGSRAP